MDFTPEQLAAAKAYHAPWYLFSAIDLVLWPALLAVSTFVVNRRLLAWSQRVASSLAARWPRLRTSALGRALDAMWKGPGWGAAVLYGLGLFGSFTLLALPTDVYFAYLRERDWGMTQETPWTFAFDHVKGTLVLAGSVSALTFGMFGLARRLRNWWWIIGFVGAVGMFASSFADPYRSRLYFDQTPLPAGELRERITALMVKAQIDFRDVLVEKTAEHSVRVQAYFAGQGPTRTIVLNDSLLKEMGTDEVLAVVAHEAGHVHESRWLGRIGSSLALFAFLGLVEALFRWSARRKWQGVTERADLRTLPLILLIFELLTMVAAPLSGWQSRARESAADQFALELTRDSKSFRSMLVKAAVVNKMDPDPPRWYVIKGLSHPPISERIAAVDAWKTRSP